MENAESHVRLRIKDIGDETDDRRIDQDPHSPPEIFFVRRCRLPGVREAEARQKEEDRRRQFSCQPPADAVEVGLDSIERLQIVDEVVCHHENNRSEPRAIDLDESLCFLHVTIFYSHRTSQAGECLLICSCIERCTSVHSFHDNSVVRTGRPTPSQDGRRLQGSRCRGFFFPYLGHEFSAALQHGCLSPLFRSGGPETAVHAAGTGMHGDSCNKMRSVPFLRSNVKAGIYLYRQGIHPLGRAHSDPRGLAPVAGDVGEDDWKSRRLSFISIAIICFS